MSDKKQIINVNIGSINQCNASVEVLKKEAFVGDYSDKQIEFWRSKLEEKYNGKISFVKTVSYLPILTKNGD
ncbi:MAG TPA: hypothetical protein PLN63_06710 [Paludibacteraceae bacterium]|mgnify:CR=1 FL=1|nr:hypothetical protein [Paludibacteraceae bacterium]HOU68037.1 hypothetical protein [Paludibacteraceae bacterium]HPH63292.1 hypothetical protein [Paludibacteraceae bacterium]HQF49962.1 hypothetical protein [Paludibacteraceae bacterium]HQJ89876.1 hypothetical protein [Paludibacteraceae bacterium]